MTDTQVDSSQRKTASLMISYSRKDKEFVKQLYDELVTQGFSPEDIWVDWEEIPLSADWMAEITKGIQSSNAFIFVISPDSVASDVCKKEIEIAASSNKRFIPIMYREPGKDAKLHEKISSHNWVFIRDENELVKTMPALVEAINTDLDWLAQHTRLFNRAKEWESKGRNDSYLVRGNDLQEAETFISEGAGGKEPSPTPLHVQYVQAARKFAASVRRRNQIIAAVVGVALVALSIFAFFQRDKARENEKIAEMNAIKAEQQRAIAVEKEQIATEAKKQAELEKANAEKRRRVANSYALAADALNQRSSNTQLSLMLALLSIRETEVDKVVLPESRSALFSSLNMPNVLRTWDVSSVVWATAYDPTGIHAAFGDDSGAVQIIDVESREIVRSLPSFDGSISGLDFNSNGSLLAVSSLDGTAAVFSVETGMELFSLTGHDGDSIYDIDISPNGQLIATAGDDGLVKIWFGETGSLKTSLPRHTDRVNDVEFSPDSTRLISGSYDNTAIIWDVENNSLLSILRPAPNEDVESVAFSPDGSRIMTGGYKTVVLWDATSGSVIQRLYGDRSLVYDVGFSPDNLNIATASSGIKIWDGTYGIERLNLSSHNGEVNSVSYNFGGDQMITGSWDSTVKLWAAIPKIETLRLVQEDSPNIFVDYSPDGYWIVTTSEDGHVIVYDALTCRIVADATARVEPDVTARVGAGSVLFDPQNSQRFLVIDKDNTVKIWALGQEKPVRVIGDETHGMRTAAYSSDGKKILTIGFDNKVQVWDADNEGAPEEIGQYAGGDKSLIWDIWFNDNEYYILSSSEDQYEAAPNEARIWDLGNGSSSPLLLKGHTDWVELGVFSHDGNFVYTSGYDNKIIKWDVKTGEQRGRMTGHTGRVIGLNISMDDSMVASASADTTVRVWNVENAKELYRFRGYADEINSVAFSPDGKKVLSAGIDMTTREFTIDLELMTSIARGYEAYKMTDEECQRYLKLDECPPYLSSLFDGASVTSDTVPEGTTSLKSGDGTTSVTLFVENNTNFDVDIFWIDFEGRERIYFSAIPGDVYEVGTYSTHIWRVRDSHGAIVVDNYTVTEEPSQTLNISGEPVSNSTQPETGANTDNPASSSSTSASSSIYYTEEFNGNLAWDRFMVTGTENQVIAETDGGSLVIHLKPDEDKIPRFYLVNGESEYSNVQMELVTTNNGNNANGVSLVCNYDGTHWYEFTISNGGSYSISAYDPTATALQGYIQLAEGGSGAIKTGQVTNVYRAICNGNELSLYINNTLVKKIVDTVYNLTSGKIGLGVSSPQTLPVDVSFESLMVSEP